MPSGQGREFPVKQGINREVFNILNLKYRLKAENAGI